MSLEENMRRITYATKETLKTLIEKMGGTVSDELIDQYPTIAAGLGSFTNKQDKIIGTKGQIVGFDDNGNMIAQDASDIGGGSGSSGASSVSSVNGHTGDVTLSASDVGAPSTDDFTSHTGNQTMHITASERSGWNNGLQISYATATHPLYMSDYSASGIASANGRGKCVIVNAKGYSSCTSDGHTFSARQYLTALTSNDNIYRIAYGNGRFVVISSESSNIMYSENGEDWAAEYSVLPYSSGWDSIAFGNGVFVAVGINSSSNAIFATSSDGVTWSGGIIRSATGSCGVAFGNGFFVSAFKSGSNFISHKSTDGMTWELVSASLSLSEMGPIAPIQYGNGVFVGVSMFNGSSYEGKTSIYSEDGLNWSTYECPRVLFTPYPDSYQTFRFGGGKVIAIGYDGNTGICSSDGKTWESFTMPFYGKWTCLTYFKNMYVLMVKSSSTVYFSTNGTSWSNTYPSSIKSSSGTDLLNDFSIASGLLNRAYYPSISMITLSADGWNNLFQSVTTDGVSNDELSQIIQICPSASSMTAYYDAGIICSGQSTNTLTFTAQTAPSENLIVYAVIEALA